MRDGTHTGKFWLVFNPFGSSPKHMHPTHVEAETEAKRLAGENPGHKFFVMEALNGFEKEAPPPPPVVEVDMAKFTYDNIPF